LMRFIVQPSLPVIFLLRYEYRRLSRQPKRRNIPVERKPPFRSSTVRIIMITNAAKNSSAIVRCGWAAHELIVLSAFVMNLLALQ